MSTVKMLEKWLKKPENTKAKLASLLGYDTTNAISQWVKRCRIPKHQEARVVEIIRGKK